MTRLLALSAVAALSLGLVGVSHAQDSGADNFTVDTSRTTRDVSVGDRGTISVVIVPGKGKKVHEQAPLTVTLKGPVGLGLMKNKLGHADVVNKGAPAPELKAEFAPKQPGQLTADVDMVFFICTDKWCERMTHKTAIAVTVK